MNDNGTRVHSVYAYVFDDGHVYVGLTNDPKNRNASHRNSRNSAVYGYWTETGRKDFPDMFVLCDGLTLEEACRAETVLVNAVVPELRLNKVGGGNPGGRPNVTDERRNHLLVAKTRREHAGGKPRCMHTWKYYETHLSEFCGMMAWRAGLRQLERALPVTTGVMVRHWGEMLAGEDPARLFVATATGHLALRLTWADKKGSGECRGSWSGPGYYSLMCRDDGSGQPVTELRPEKPGVTP